MNDDWTCAVIGATSAGAGASGGTDAGAKKATKNLTLSAKFKLDLDSLMQALKSTAPHFIRCVKPNMEQVLCGRHCCLLVIGTDITNSCMS